ncbi:phosphate acyltransferase [Bacteroidia bacterium]|nr:phosphate acyltransferase [Bacteroidia bacterium]
MKIGIDVMGGDHAPEVVVQGVVKAFPLLAKDSRMVLFGDKEQVLSLFGHENFDASQVDIVPTTQVIEMGEHPAKAFQQKQDSSITVGFKALGSGAIDSFASAGSTGAMLVGTMYTVKTIEGISRPCIPTFVPQYNGGTTLLVDAGLNADCKPEMLYQFAVLGSVFVKGILGIEKPRVALLSNGSENEKGNVLTLAAHALLKAATNIHFIGNVESNKLYFGAADVIVCDGFVGNIVLKQAEATYALSRKMGINNEFFAQFNDEIYGGMPLLGASSTVIIAHGHSSPEAIKNMILQTEKLVQAKIIEKVRQALA